MRYYFDIVFYNMAQRVAPKAVRFDDLLPLGVKGVAKARSFQPNNGATFNSTNNIIRIPLNSTGFLDGKMLAIV